jgi:hypothetical protein
MQIWELGFGEGPLADPETAPRTARARNSLIVSHLRLPLGVVLNRG